MAKEKSQDSIPLNDQLRAIDRKDRNFRNKLPDELKKKLSTYLMMRYAASVEGHVDLQSYYMIATNENVNKHFFDIKNHPELQWLCCTTVSPGMGVQRHYWFNGAAKKDNQDKYTDKLFKAVCELRPNQKIADCELWMELVGTEEVEKWILAHGQELPPKK
jgi:hypothetical protein